MARYRKRHRPLSMRGAQILVERREFRDEIKEYSDRKMVGVFAIHCGLPLKCIYRRDGQLRPELLKTIRVVHLMWRQLGR